MGTQQRTRQLKTRHTDDVLDWLEAEAAERGVSKTKVVEIALAQLRFATEHERYRREIQMRRREATTS